MNYCIYRTRRRPSGGVTAIGKIPNPEGGWQSPTWDVRASWDTDGKNHGLVESFEREYPSMRPATDNGFKSDAQLEAEGFRTRLIQF